MIVAPATNALYLQSAHVRCSAPPSRHWVMEKYLIKLYVTGRTPRSQQAIRNLQQICEEELNGRYELVVIDVLERPQLAEDEKILATPTVVKELPIPMRRIIGDLSDTERVLLGLDLRPAPTDAMSDGESAERTSGGKTGDAR